MSAGYGMGHHFPMWPGGGINGLYQVVGEILQPIRNKAVSVLQLNRKSLGHRLIHIVGTFILVDFSWIFFRADRLLVAFKVIQKIAEVKNPWVLFDGSLYNCGLDSKNFWLMIICLFILLFADYCKTKGIVIRKVIILQDYWFRCLFIVFAVCSIMLFGKWGPSFDKANFIYFQF